MKLHRAVESLNEDEQAHSFFSVRSVGEILLNVTKFIHHEKTVVFSRP